MCVHPVWRLIVRGVDAIALDRLLLISELINQCIGDAISDLLLVELILATKNWALSDWNALYTDLPSLQMKVKVTDHTRVKTADAERRCTAPPTLQDRIAAAVHNKPYTAAYAAQPIPALQGNRRAFVRPSGTEPVVRIYCEADTATECSEMAAAIKTALEVCCN